MKRAGALVAFWLMVLAIDLLAGWGTLRLRFDDGLDKVFESADPAYAHYQAYLNDYAVAEGDHLVVLSGVDFATPAAWAALRDFVFEVQFQPDVAAIMSPFSLDLPASGDIAGAIAARRATNPALGRFISADRQVVLVAVVAERGAGQGLAPLDERLSALGRQMLGPVGAQVRITGYPALRDNVVKAVFGDFLTNILIGTALGTVVAIVALRSVTLALMATVTSGTALLWMMGAFGLAGIAINVVTISLPVLILVLSFASAIHLTFEVRRLAAAGVARPVWQAVRRIGPACVLTTITTAAAFASLMLSRSTLIAEMGLAGALATLISLLAVFAAQPLLLATGARWPGLDQLFAPPRGEVRALWRLRGLQALAARWPGAISAGSVLTLVLAVAIYTKVEPVYSLHDNVATDSEAYEALLLMERDLAPLGSIVFPTRFDPTTPDGLAGLARAGEVLRRHAGGLEVLSLADFTAASGLPDTLRQRLVSRDGHRALLMLLVPNEGAVAVRAQITRLQADLAADPDWPSAEVDAPTGLLVASSFLSRDMLLDLNRCFLVAVAVSGLVVALWLRNPVLGLIALVPNVLPVALVGAWLTLSGAGLEFSSGIALTIAFGLAIDDTIHVLNRMRLDARPGQAVDRALVPGSLARVAPALVITSGVLSFGLLATQFGQLDTVAYFGRLSIAAFVLALVADLTVLPAILIVAARLLPARLLRIRR